MTTEAFTEQKSAMLISLNQIKSNGKKQDTSDFATSPQIVWVQFLAPLFHHLLLSCSTAQRLG